tara:strand:- start:209514 stop:210647 length:1134 start_codon:yes stop_codon:yes gene_type:complete
MDKIQFIDLKSQQKPIADNINLALQKVLEHGQYILGPEVQAFETALKEYTEAKAVVSCANGTDALKLLLLANNVGKGDAVFVPTFTFAATAEVVPYTQATPFFVDICPETFNIDLISLEQAVQHSKKLGLKPKCIMAVDLFGLPANYPALQELADAHNMLLIADSAQSFGGKINDAKVGTLASMTATSFFPAKPLGCYGDGGGIMTQDLEIAERLKALRVHGACGFRYDYQYIGLNSRLDSMQAAVLIEKLKIFDDEWKKRQHIASLYQEGLHGSVKTPVVPKGYQSAWALYTIVCQPKQRDLLEAHLKDKQVPYGVYYRTPMHLQPAYEAFPRAQEKLTISEKLSHEVISLPMHPYLSDEQVHFIIEQVNHVIKQS